MEKDPLTGETVEVLWVKGSGGDSRHDQARRLRHALHGQAARAEGPLSRRRARGRDGGLPAPLHLQPQPARRLDRHAAACLSCRTAMSTTCIPTRSSRSPPSKNSQGADAGDLRRRDRLAAVEAAGLRARPVAGEILRATTRRPRASSSKATACSPGATRRRNATRRRSRIINQAIDWFESETAGKPAFGGAGASSRCRRRSAAPSPRG